MPLKKIRQQFSLNERTLRLSEWTTRMSDLDYLRNLVDSMLRRLQEVIDHVGVSTHY